MQQIIELLETADQAVNSFKDTCVSKELSAAASQCSYLSVLYLHILNLLDKNTCPTQFSDAIAKNILEALEKLKECIKHKNMEQAVRLYEYELFPLHRHLYKNLHFWLLVYPEKEKWPSYYKQQDEALQEYTENKHAYLSGKYTYDVTIMVLAYNNLEYTKIAVESILKYTDFDKYRIELLLINNGSTDETAAYFEPLKSNNVQIVNLTYPVGFLGVSLGAYAAKGKYFVLFANDVVATTNWLENLLACITSSEDIAWVVPACNACSNYQAISIIYENPMEDDSQLQDFARVFNQTDPQKWEERVRLIPFLCIAPSALFRCVADEPLYYYGEFWDDDLSARFRRAGLRQLFAKDTYMHHFGSISSNQTKILNNSLEVMRQNFYDKWQVDAWDSMYFNQSIISAACETVQSNIHLLVVDPLFGSTPLQIRNTLRARGQTIETISAIVTDDRYLPDAKKQFDTVIAGELQSALKQLEAGRYNCIVFHNDFNQYVDKNIHTVITLLKEIAAPGGKVYFTVSLPSHFRTLQQLANGNIPSKFREPWNTTQYIDYHYLQSAGEECGWNVQVINQNFGYYPHESKTLDICKQLLSDPRLENRLLTSSVLFVLENTEAHQ